MKIYFLSVHSKLRPQTQIIKYPAHNKDYGVEQDFYEYLLKHTELTVSNPDEADWHYLPVYWTRWHLNHDYGKTGLEELQDEINTVILNDAKTFTVCQYDDGPLVKIGDTVQFLSSRKSQFGIDIPLLASTHRRPFFKRRKRFLASFVGRLETHSIRQEMYEVLKSHDNVFVHDGDKGAKYFRQTLLLSYIALCPRGYGGSSFRFFEAMQLGIVPFLISDIDTRPFKQFIDWNKCSLFTSDVGELVFQLKHSEIEDLLLLANRALETYDKIRFGKWCDFLLKELEART